MSFNIDDFRAAGLYDPDAPDAEQRLAMLEWLAAHGATMEQIGWAVHKGALIELAGELGRMREARLTLADASAVSGMPVERIEAVRFALGLPRLEPDEAAMTEGEALSLTVFDRGEELFGESALRRFTQVMGTSIARIAEAGISLSLANLLSPLRESGGSELVIAEARFNAARSIPPLAELIGHLFRAHTAVAARRIEASYEQGFMDTVPMAVGFLDLVGFTALARQIDARALADVIDRFEETAQDVTAANNGRVVKFIGDEVMFVTSDASTACEVALALLDSFADDPIVRPRGAIAAGDVLVRGGDYYGPIVNLAARAAGLAAPDEVLVTEAVANEAPGAFRFEPAGRRVLKGFNEPVRFLTVERPVTGRD